MQARFKTALQRYHRLHRIHTILHGFYALACTPNPQTDIWMCEYLSARSKKKGSEVKHSFECHEIHVLGKSLRLTSIPIN